MAQWPWKKEELPESLRELTPEQIAQALLEKKELEQKLADQQTQADGLKTELEQVQAKVRELESRPATQPQPQPQPQPRSGPESVLIDEDKAFADRLAGTNALAFHAAALSAKIMARDQIRNSDERRIWDKYESEVDEIMGKETPDRRAFPAIWINAFTYVKGLHLKELMLAQKEGNDFFAEPVGRGPEPAPQPGQGDKLTDEELRVCANMKIKPEEYLAQRKEMQGVS